MNIYIYGTYIHICVHVDIYKTRNYCLPCYILQQPKDTTRSDETMLVKTLLPQLCLLLNYDSCDHLLISQLKTSAARVLYALSLNNFNAVFSRISAWYVLKGLKSITFHLISVVIITSHF